MRQNEKSVSPMSNEGRNAYVIEHITGALLKLLREKTHRSDLRQRIVRTGGDRPGILLSEL